MLPFRADGWMHRSTREERRHIVRGKVRAIRLPILAAPFLLAQLIARLDMELAIDFYAPSRGAPCVDDALHLTISQRAVIPRIAERKRNNPPRRQHATELLNELDHLFLVRVSENRERQNNIEPHPQLRDRQVANPLRVEV